MSSITEFFCIAIAIFLWESTLWMPLRGVVLRRRRGNHWKVLDPSACFAARELGLIPMWPLPPDHGLAPCQVPPLAINGGPDGGLLMTSATHAYFPIKSLDWNDLQTNQPYFSIRNHRTCIASPRCIEPLRMAKLRGHSVASAVHRQWRRALSPWVAGREWRRWKLVSSPLRWNAILLTLGFFIGLPTSYLCFGSLATLLVAAWLWCLMACTAGHLWWLGKTIYPAARSSLQMDALLALFVPFHAMRAMEIASVHAMSTIHPVSLLLWSRQLDHPWLAHFLRQIIHPLPAQPHNQGFCLGLKPFLITALGACGRQLSDYDHPPIGSDDAEARQYCPRCHGLYLTHVQTCPDCHGIPLRPQPDSPPAHAPTSLTKPPTSPNPQA